MPAFLSRVSCSYAISLYRLSNLPRSRGFLPLALYARFAVDNLRSFLPFYHLLGDRANAHGLVGGNFVHHIHHDVFDNGAKTSGTGLPLQRKTGNFAHRTLGELELYIVELKELLVLLHQRILRLCQNADQRLLVEQV